MLEGGYEQLQCNELDEWNVSYNPPIRSLQGIQFKEPPTFYTKSPLPHYTNFQIPPRPIVPVITSSNQNQAPSLKSSQDFLGIPKMDPMQTTPPNPAHRIKEKGFQSTQSEAYKRLTRSEGCIQSPPQPTLAAALPTLPESNSNSVGFTITVCKRSNGNQPWERSNIRPPMLGKMRRITVQFGPVPVRLELLFQCKDMKLNRHEGKLVISTNDKGIARNSFATEDQTLLKTTIPACHTSQTHVAYLKPCWRGFGNNRERPIFTVIIAVRPADEDSQFVIIHSWQVELHSHKMESSPKGKAMDARGPFEIANVIPVTSNTTNTTSSKPT